MRQSSQLYKYSQLSGKEGQGWKWGGWKWGACVSKSLYPNCPSRHLHMVPLWKLSAWWTTEFSPVYANPTSLNKEEGRMVKDTDAGDGVSAKTPRGRQRETTSLIFPRIWLVKYT